jgi:hypothetical protein
MIIIQDFREKHGHHNSIEQYCKENNILLYRMKLEVGDYMLGTFQNGKYVPIGNISVDTKQDLSELATDLYKDKLAFNKKYRKCYDNKIQLYVLVEQEVKTLRDIVTWSSPHTRVNGRLLLDMIDRLRKSYGVKFVFCPKNQTAQNIIKILTENNENKETENK